MQLIRKNRIKLNCITKIKNYFKYVQQLDAKEKMYYSDGGSFATTTPLKNLIFDSI